MNFHLRSGTRRAAQEAEAIAHEIFQPAEESDSDYDPSYDNIASRPTIRPQAVVPPLRPRLFVEGSTR